MKITAIIPESDSYWNVLKDLSDEVKLDLISCLSQSLLRSKAEKKQSPPVFFMAYGKTRILLRWVV